jgi:threonine synthase
MSEISASKLNQSAWQLRCISCGAVQENCAQNFRCSGCGDLLEVLSPAWKASSGTGLPRFDPAALKRLWLQRRTSSAPIDQSGVWRFRELLPGLSDPRNAITLREGNTPVYELPKCARAIGLTQLYAKHQGMNPTGSFKDTGMTVASSFARQAGFAWVACASTGNTSASMAAYAARGGMHSLVLVPEGQITWGKLSQALDYGAVTCQLRTDFDGCMRVLNELVDRAPVYLLNSVNPFRLEGQKTAAIELLEFFDWQVPDHVLVPGGNMGNSSALGKAFLEMKELGLISTLPKISIIQAEGANPLVRTLRETCGRELITVEADTLATAIRIGSPASWKKAVRVLEATGGTVEDSTDMEIALAKAEIGSDGIGCEPASAVTLAGLKKLTKRNFVRAHETVVLVLTGHLLKDPDFTLGFHRGGLFKGTAHEQDGGTLKSQQRPPVLLKAGVDEVLKVLERSELEGTKHQCGG